MFKKALIALVLLFGIYSFAGAQTVTKYTWIHAGLGDVPYEAKDCYVWVDFGIWEAGNPSNWQESAVYMQLDEISDVMDWFLFDSHGNDWYAYATIFAQDIGLGSDGKEYRVTEFAGYVNDYPDWFHTSNLYLDPVVAEK